MMEVTFSATENPTSEGDFVTRTGKIFEVGNWPNKVPGGFALTPQEMDAECSRFQPVKLGKSNPKWPNAGNASGHKPSSFDLGRFGEINKLWNDGKNLYADVKLNKHIDAYFPSFNRTSLELKHDEAQKAQVTDLLL